MERVGISSSNEKEVQEEEIRSAETKCMHRVQETWIFRDDSDVILDKDIIMKSIRVTLIRVKFRSVDLACLSFR